MDYTVSVYDFSAAQLPADERFNLVAQLRRAAVSVPLNIAEGAGCATNPEFARFLSYAYRSLKEVVTCLELCQRLHTSTVSAAAPLIDEGNQISRMTYSLLQRLGGS
jgi:four helix bundle protein